MTTPPEAEALAFAAVQAAVADRYDVTGTLGSGGMGTVYAGRHRSLNSPVAIKVLPPEVAASEMRLARFHREASLAAHLSHPHIVPVFEFDVRAGLAFLIMPLIDGTTLDVHIEEHGRLSYAEASELLRQIGGALAFAHDRGIIHRDVKPANILLERATGRWLLTDFGVAHGELAILDGEITRTGESVGTPAYMAPEQAGGAAEVDGRADLYALAATILVALTGERPDLTLSRNALTRWFRSSRPDIAPQVAEALTLPLELARDQRPVHIRAWLEALAHAERRRLVKPWAAVAALAVAGFIGWWTQYRKPEALSASRTTVAILPFQVVGRNPGIDLRSVLPPAFAWQLQMLPDYRVIAPAVVSREIQRRFGAEPDSSIDTMLQMARGLGATRVLVGQAETARDRITIRIQVYDPANRRMEESVDTSGVVDSLHALVAGLVIRGFANQLARERSGLPSPSLPRGIPAIQFYFQGDQDLRQAKYDEAVDQFNRVIALDSTYAPAYLKRMLATVQLLPTEAQIRPAMPGPAHKARLDPASRRLLEAYEHLINEGDVGQAVRELQKLLEDYPEAVDGWFALGELQFHFGSLVGIPLAESKRAFQEVLVLDPAFATALAHLIMLAIAEKDDPAAKGYITRYLAIDSTSLPAQLVGIADTLLFHKSRALRVLNSFPRRSPEVLQEIAFIAGEFSRSPLERAIGRQALDALWQRASRGDERDRAFRMLLANHLGAGRFTSAQALMRTARASGVGQDELDRWIVLSGIVPIGVELGDEKAQAAAAGHLRTTSSIDPLIARWLAVRWFMRHDQDQAIEARRDFQRLIPAKGVSSLQFALQQDLEAWDFIEKFDTTGALGAWRRATVRFSIEQVPFSLAASLWPLRFARARMLLASNGYRDAIDVSSTFLRITAYVDQVAWPHMLRLRGDAALKIGDTELAKHSYQDLYSILESAEGEAIPLRDQAKLALEELEAARTPGQIANQEP